jgi:site-specific DNA-methyltransferase (cytosine-N4-specific)
VWSINTKAFKGAHFATFPTELPRVCILAGSARQDLILDPFAGSGATCAVAKALGRHFLGIELNADYAPLFDKRIAEGV